MSAMEADVSTLFALLARHWQFAPGVETSAFDVSGRSAVFALADGTLALATTEDEESANSRWRVSIEDGRATISPRRRPVPEPTIVPIDVAPIRVAPFAGRGFLAGGASGRLVAVAPDGTTRALVELDSGPVDAIRPASGHAAFVAAGGVVTRYDAHGSTARAVGRYEDPLRAMAPSPDARRVALGFDRCVTIEPTDDDGPERVTFDLDSAQALEWSPDGRVLAVGLARGGIALIEPETPRVLRLPDYPGAVGTLDWATDSRLLATSGAFRAIVWNLREGESKPRTIETGRATFVAVTVARLHPHRSLLAIGYENGTIIITRIGDRDELVVRDPSPGAIVDLHWSPDGEHLAFHTLRGSAGILDLPAHMFK